MTFRNEHLTRLAKGRPCMAEVPNVCNHDTETTVWAHSNELRHGKGRGIKAQDCFGAFMCSGCHHWYDHGPAPREWKAQIFRDAFERTLVYLWSRGLITVAGSTQRESAYKPLAKILPRTYA